MKIFLKKISPKAFFTLFTNLNTIHKIYCKIAEDEKIINYLKVFEKDILQAKAYCESISAFINTNLDFDLAKDIDQLQNFETNFIKKLNVSNNHL